MILLEQTEVVGFDHAIRGSYSEIITGRLPVIPFKPVIKERENG